MAKLQGVTARRMADEFVAELFNRYRAPHVRQVASWIGFIVYGVEKLNEGKWDPATAAASFQDGQILFLKRGHQALFRESWPNRWPA